MKKLFYTLGAILAFGVASAQQPNGQVNGTSTRQDVNTPASARQNKTLAKTNPQTSIGEPIATPSIPASAQAGPGSAATTATTTTPTVTSAPQTTTTQTGTANQGGNPGSGTGSGTTTTTGTGTTQPTTPATIPNKQ